ncbi:Smr/MutS family protein [Aureimonas glaciei]|uniref:DNA repair protein n=1 Tax=Aureimonas glaciei TaxID=1776957 RepID=A0A916V1Z3_9HYPH|nr:Smr/MutS family protein [Aureimonas glaciei]GGD02004.1 DNA repair protein [Aureimonas glaciei]
MRRRRALSEEEARLWAGVARQTQPLPGKHLPDVVAGEPTAVPTSPSRAKKAALPKAIVRRIAAAMAAVPKVEPVSPPTLPAPLPVPKTLMPAYQAPALKRKVPPLHPIERPVTRKLGKGRLPIEARIDLHDKTQIVAHYALLGFLRRAQADGMRHVLVITGRGASFGSRGVIKRSLPHWFDTAEFRPLVAGFEPAERGHGGEGAFYVRVRRR